VIKVIKKIEKLDDMGRGITYVNNKITFVPNALVGEEVDIKELEEHKKYNICTSFELLNESPERCKDICKYYNDCGGCSIYHMNEELELLFKKRRIEDIMLHYAGIKLDDIEIISGNMNGYRNKITLRVKDGKLGLLKEKTNDIVKIDECLIANSKINSLIKILNEKIKKQDINKIIIKTSNDEVMLGLYGKVNNIDDFKDICDSLYINDIPATNKYITKKIGNKNYHIRLLSFFQVNDEICKKLFDEIRKIVKEIKPKRVLDLYSGVGTIGIYISDVANEVLGVETVKEAVIDAEENKKINNVKNISFINNKVENIIDKLNGYDLIITDPPRKGLDTKTKETLKKINPKNIIYVSCNIMTLARDIKDLDDYELESIKLFNMFPRTYHFESLALLRKK